jgi:transposase
LDPKKRTVVPTERNEEYRTAWREAVNQIAPERLVFVDESGTNIAMTPRYGRAPRGQRVSGTAPRNWGMNTTLLATLTSAGISAALVVEGATDRPVFEVFIEEVLLPTLQPGQVVVWDNLSVHKSQRARELIEGQGCQVLFLPAYSPDFNPIEQAFSKLKGWLRQREARTVEQLWVSIGDGLARITARDARGWYQHCGYSLSPGQYL